MSGKSLYLPFYWMDGLFFIAYLARFSFAASYEHSTVNVKICLKKAYISHVFNEKGGE